MIPCYALTAAYVPNTDRFLVHLSVVFVYFSSPWPIADPIAMVVSSSSLVPPLLILVRLVKRYSDTHK